MPQLFVRNNRVAIVIDTETLGRVTVVMVGATIVGRISVTAMPAPARAAWDSQHHAWICRSRAATRSACFTWALPLSCCSSRA